MAEPRTITIVLVHGAFAESLSNWKPVLGLLLAKGYKVVAAPNPLRGVSSDAAYVSSFLNTIDGPIILVGHSYGGAVITNAASGNQNVKALVYVAAFAPDKGESVATLLRRFPGSSVEANTAPILLADGSRDLYFQPDKFREQYAADLPETETKLLALTQRPMAERAMSEVSNVAAWKAIPSWFIFGTRDNSIPANLLAFMAERAGSKTTVTIEGASHAVMMSHADAVVELVEQAAAAVGDDGVHRSSVTGTSAPQTAGNLIFLGHVDGTFSAYDARSLKELWSFNVGTGMNAPPITYSVNGKQYVAVLAGSRQPINIIRLAPELKYTSTASMLYVFGL